MYIELYKYRIEDRKCEFLPIHLYYLTLLTNKKLTTII